MPLYPLLFVFLTPTVDLRSGMTFVVRSRKRLGFLLGMEDCPALPCPANWKAGCFAGSGRVSIIGVPRFFVNKISGRKLPLP